MRNIAILAILGLAIYWWLTQRKTDRILRKPMPGDPPLYKIGDSFNIQTDKGDKHFTITKIWVGAYGNTYYTVWITPDSYDWNYLTYEFDRIVLGYS